MSSAEQDLYQEVIIEHKRAPRNFGTLANRTHQARGTNPQCGDDISVALRLDEQRIEYETAEAAGKVLATRIDIPEWLATTLPDSVREQMSRDWVVGGIIPTGDWSSPIPLDVEAFYADPAMYTSAFSLALEVQHIANTQRSMRESAAALRQHVEAQIEQ